MHKTYIKLLSTLTIIILLIFISACVKGSNPKVLRIGVSGQMPPYSYYDEKNNKLVGFDIDIANEIARRMNKQVDIQVYDFNRLIAAVLSKQIDFGMGSMNIVPERQEVVNFTEPYNVSRGRFTYYSNIKNINSIEDIKKSNELVGIRNGTVYPKILLEEYGFSHDQLKIFPSQRDLIIGLKNGSIKVAISDYGAMHHLNKHSDLNLTIIPINVTRAPAGITVNKNNKKLLEEIDKAIIEMKNDGSYLKIATKWFGADPFKDEEVDTLK